MTPYCSAPGCHDPRTHLYGRREDGRTVTHEHAFPEPDEVAWLRERSVGELVRLCRAHSRLLFGMAQVEGPAHVCRPPAAQIFRGRASWSCVECGRVWVRCGGGWESRGSAAG